MHWNKIDLDETWCKPTYLNVRQVEVEFADRVCLGGIDSLEAGEEQLVTRAVRLCVGAAQAECKSTVFDYFSQTAKLFAHHSPPVVSDPISSLESLHLDRAVVVGSATSVHLKEKSEISGLG